MRLWFNQRSSRFGIYGNTVVSSILLSSKLRDLKLSNSDKNCKFLKFQRTIYFAFTALYYYGAKSTSFLYISANFVTCVIYGDIHLPTEHIVTDI